MLDAIVLQPLPFRDPASLVRLHNRWTGFDRTWVNRFEIRTYAERSSSIAEAAWWGSGFRNLTGDGEAVRVAAGWVTANTFDVLGTPPQLGRVFTEEEDVPEGPAVVIVAHELPFPDSPSRSKTTSSAPIARPCCS